MGKELGIDTAHMGWILSAFGWTYALFQIPGGWLVDRMRPRLLLSRHPDPVVAGDRSSGRGRHVRRRCSACAC